MTLMRVAAALSVLWIGAMAVVCVQSWPTIPLDLDARDPALQAALRRAGLMHALKYAVAGLAPAALLVAVAWWGARRRTGAGRPD